MTCRALTTHHGPIAMTAAWSASLFTLGVGACGGGSGSHDAAVDIDNGTCGAMIRFTGEYVDWDSDDQDFCGIARAIFKVRDTGPATAPLAPNGRVDLCVPDQPTTLIDISTPPKVDVSCHAGVTYPLPGIAVANKAVILAGGSWSGRSFVEGREPYDPTKAQVHVHIDGPPRAVSLDAAHPHGQVQAVVTDTWAPGNTGHEIFIPDVAPSGGSATLSVAGGAIGAGSIPLEAGRMTTLTVITR